MAFSKFPKRVWVVILENLESVQDISNVFEAYPEMETLIEVFKSNHNNWYFALLFPHVLPWLTKREALLCRKVCKQWSQAVDHSLQNHPSRRAYNPAAQPQPWIPLLRTPSPYYSPLWGYFNHISNDFETGVDVLFDNCRKVNHFLYYASALCNYPQDRNPFIGRSVKISDYQWKKDVKGRAQWTSQLSNCWNMVINLLLRHGAHIRHLDISRTDVLWMDDKSQDAPYKPTDLMLPQQSQVDFSELVLDCLNHVPCLESLKLQRVRRYAPQEFNLGLNLSTNVPLMPVLSHLETLEMISSDLPERLVNILVTSYSSQIRSLSINGKYWRSNYLNAFPILTEFRLLEEGLFSEERISNLILSLEAPQLAKLHLSFRDHKLVVEDKIIPWLKRFSKVESLTLDYLGICQDRDIICKEKRKGSSFEQVGSLKHLWINHYAGENHSIINFLRSFPLLETLTIYPKLRNSGCFKHENMFEPVIWSRLPNVKTITVLESGVFGIHPEPQTRRMPVHYSRCDYEY